MRISDWSSDVCSSDLIAVVIGGAGIEDVLAARVAMQTRRMQAVEGRHQRGSTVDHRGIDHLSPPRPRRFQQGADNPEGEIERPAAEIAYQSEWRHRRPAAPATVLQAPWPRHGS